MITIPTGKTVALEKGPKLHLLFSKPKTGKSSALAQLEGNFIIEMDPGGGNYISYWGIDVRDEAKKANTTPFTILREVATALGAMKTKPKYITLDTVTELEDIILPYALELYKATPMGKNFDGDDVRKLPNGSGYAYTREAFSKIVTVFGNLADNLILVGHLKERSIEKNGKEFSASEIDLSGKNKSITAAEADAIGYMYREGNKNYINYATKDDVICGARPKHLRNQVIEISELLEDGTLVTHWDRIYI